ncbi:phosphotyrosine protein phosphatase [Micromonospora sp. NPDC047793]|uniref:arsenate reductase/protein-tyrosine-phosphatase family protein n=1 Tax=unclassified Micromonospora TaxID=2617518 RepID=UPI001034ADFC|nr:phosphotyrosine protein phosphatase [Verrucosispora sp. SN26_14.1]TBL31384.1 phosphotyrosine protein phosphatase [Verrucosispora sp. SN26_14.1]
MPPFTVLHVCMGNICRSPMAERLLTLAVGQRLARRDLDPGRVEELLHSHSAGTGGWHAGEEMNPPAARQVTTRGGTVSGFAARKLRSDHIDAADLVLTATADQQEYVVALRPDAAARTFVLGEFGRLLTALDRDGLPSVEATPDAVYARGVAVVEAANVARQGTSLLPSDDLDDPWGRGDQCFSRVADEIEETIHPLAAILLP